MRVKAKTYEDLIESIKGKKLEDLTKQEVFDLYICYGNRQMLSDISAQRQLVKYGFTDWLACSVETVITDKEVITGILESDIFEKNKKLNIIKCKIENIQKGEPEKQNKDFFMIYINVLKQDTKNIKTIEYLCYKHDDDPYIDEIKSYIGQEVTIIAKKEKAHKQVKDNKTTEILKLCSILDTSNTGK